MSESNKEEFLAALKSFKARRDELLHEDTNLFQQHLNDFLKLLRTNARIAAITSEPNPPAVDLDVETWWKTLDATRRGGTIQFPDNKDENFILRLRILESVAGGNSHLFSFGRYFGKTKLNEGIELFRTLVIRPFVEELGDRLAEAAQLATPLAARLQAVPLSRIPDPEEVMIFLSHKSDDKPLVERFYEILQLLGFRPWLDKPEMPAGANLERELLSGFNRSCAAVFFITSKFEDRNYLATEIDYAIKQKRKKGDRFAIIAVRFEPTAKIPELLEPYVYVDANDALDALKQIVRALPIEVGPVRWKANIGKKN